MAKTYRFKVGDRICVTQNCGIPPQGGWVGTVIKYDTNFGVLAKMDGDSSRMRWYDESWLKNESCEYTMPDTRAYLDAITDQ